MLRALIVGLLIFLPMPSLALVNINTATSDELQTLNGVGPATAGKIIAARPFSAKEEIEQVDGIGGPGTATYEKIINDITVDGSTSVNTDDTTIDSADEEDSSSESDTSSSSKDSKELKPVGGLKMDFPDYGFVDQSIEFSVQPSDGDDDRLVRYVWNFGDGATEKAKNIAHQYRHPGTYMVVVESYYLKETKVAKGEITILSPEVSLQRTLSGVEITNESDSEMDLSGMMLSSGQWDFVFPKHTWLLSGKSVNIASVGSGEVNLYSQNGRVVASTASATAVAAPLPRISAVSTVGRQRVVDQSPTSTPTEEAVLNQTNIESTSSLAATAGAKLPDNIWPYLGLLAVMAVGVYAVFGGRGNVPV